jgi:hypothetical protein
MTLFLDIDTGLSNIYKSLVDGGHFAAAVWSSADKVPVLAIAANTIMKETNSSPPPSPKVSGLFNLSDSAETYTSCILETSASLHVQLTNETQERRKEILKAVTEAAGKYRENNTGKVRLENETILIVGKK